MQSNKILEKQRFRQSILIPLLFLVLMWMIKLVEFTFDISLSQGGVFPRHLKGLPGILFSPFIHGDLNHLWANSATLLVLGVSLFYFYPRVAFKTFLLSFFIGNVLLWIGGRESWHIGASGLIYAMAAFLVFSGFISKNFRLVAVSLIVVFLYGSFIWGVLPLNPDISWEGHLSGAITGAMLAFFFRKEIPRRNRFAWEENIDDDEHYIQYRYKPPKRRKPDLVELLKRRRDKNLEHIKNKRVSK